MNKTSNVILVNYEYFLQLNFIGYFNYISTSKLKEFFL